MGNFNTSFGEGLILVGFSDWPQLEPILFVFISIFYSLTLFGNATIITLSLLQPQLHTPIYYFLSHLSFLDLCYTTSTMPQLLINLYGPDQTITYGGYVAQLFISLALGSTLSVLLVVMAFDCYTAVCHPIHYTTIMQSHLCHILVIASWVGGFMNSLIHTGLMMAMPLCGLHLLNHFFCEMPVLLKLACENREGTEAKMYVARAIILIVPTALILGSYLYVVQVVLNVKSTAGRRKAFGTCGSHLLVVSLFYSSAMYTYLQPMHSYSETDGKFAALFYTIITPMLNTLIYTLRNKDVKVALMKVLWTRYSG
ncbi:olfactory receptor 2Y1 [Sus scrofa]|uniref:Olfactory receptor 2Y1 n=1 Tax=Sus scrofa TaxID=9823 RepID=A0A8D1MRZ6_PIG|nr:olfactory receptor 2Y1 [Sus scrofa]